MKNLVGLLLMISFSSIGLSQVKIPRGDSLFKTEKLVEVQKIPGGEARIISSAKSFKDLKAELKNALGKGWVEADPKNVDAAKKRGVAISLDSLIIYEHPDHAGMKFSLLLSDLPGKKDGERLAFLTFSREVKP